MHIFFSGIGGAGIGPLALIAMEAGYEVSGSDKQDGGYIATLKKRGIERIHVGQTTDAIKNLHSKKPIDWIVYSSAVEKENAQHPELMFAIENGIQISKRDMLLNRILQDHDKKLIAIAGTHGKTTTTGMCIWLFQQLGIPVSYSIGAKLSFGGLGKFDQGSEYFIYEADEYDRNFLSFHPYIAVISGIDYDHPDIYPTRDDYYQAFRDFICQSNHVFAHQDDLDRISLPSEPDIVDMKLITLAGEVNRKNAQLAIEAVNDATGTPIATLIDAINSFPGLSRRFEKIADNVYTDYAHTPEKVRGALQIAHEIAGDNVIVVYEGLHNTRQHFIKDELAIMFEGAKRLYIVPSYLAREDTRLELLTPVKLSELMLHPVDRESAQLDDRLLESIKTHAHDGDLVLCLTAGGGNSLDEWLRSNFKPAGKN